MWLLWDALECTCWDRSRFVAANRDWESYCGFRGQQKKTNEWVLDKAGAKRALLDAAKTRKLAYYGHTMMNKELPGERDNARNNARCTQARKTTRGLDGQHQNVDRTPSERVNQNDRGQEKMEKVRPWCGQPSDRGRLKNRTEQNQNEVYIEWQWRNFVPYLCQLVFAAFLWVKLL